MSSMRCPCGLTREELDRHGLIAPRGLCTAVWADESGNVCGKPLAAHPHQVSVAAPAVLASAATQVSAPSVFENFMVHFTSMLFGGNRDTTAVLHYYSCVIRNGRFQKCLRGKLFELAERFHGWKTTEILGIQTFDRDIRIDALFKEESKCLDFQSAVKGQMRNRKRPIVEDAVDSISLEEQPSKRLFAVSNNLLSRIELEQYVHWDNADDTNNSPPCDLTSNSLSNFSAELANINEAEVRSQMIESHNAMSLFGQSPEVAHIKDKCRCKKQEIDDPNNHIYMSRNIHQHFDGIETIPIKTPSFVLKYISHDATASDCPIFGDGCYVVNPIEKRAKVIVHIIFRDSTYAKTLAVWLRDNSLYINDRTYEISLYFPKHGVDKTIKYLKWKLKKSMEQWSDVDIHIDDD